MKKLMLVDGNAMLFRAYWATASGTNIMRNKSGIATNAIFSFTNMLTSAIDQIQPDALYVAFDAGKHTFRHDIYPAYKGTRKPAPDDLVPQFAMCRELLDAYHIKWSEMNDIEADDLIGTMSKKYPDYETIIFTSDQDYLQLVDESTHVLLQKTGVSNFLTMTSEKVKEMKGVEPLQIIDLKGLMGDKSDNIPGVKGVGEKTAVKLLQTYGTVENIIAHVDELTGSIKKKIEEEKDIALLSKQLATIRCDVELDIAIEDCVFSPNYQTLVPYLESQDMKSLANKFRSRITSDTPQKQTQPVTIINRYQNRPKQMYLYVDSDELNYLDTTVHGIAVCDEEGCYYEPIDKVQQDTQLKEAIENATVITSDAKRVMHIFKQYGIEMKQFEDVMIMQNLVNSLITSQDQMWDLYGEAVSIRYEDVYGKKNKPILLVDAKLQATRAVLYVDKIKEAYESCLPILKKEDMLSLYYDLELPLSRVLCKMEEEGIRCDINILNDIADRTYAKIKALETSIYQHAGSTFNINSPKQLSTVLFDDLGLYTGKKRSTNAEVLEKLKDAHPIIKDILEYRKFSKIYSTYAEGLKKYIRKDGRIHSIFNQASTSTGRLSSTDPNLQNISVRNEEGKEIRKAFLPDENSVLISCDYHQIELRMLAHMAHEKSLISAFQNNIDVHTKTAMDVFNVKEDEVTSAMRRQAKTVNFGIVYGISDFGLAEQLGVSVSEAKQFIEAYYKHYPQIQTYMKQLVENCEKDGYVKTMMNRRREIPEIKNKNRMVKEFGKRAAMNAPIQGSAADLIKKAMIDIDRMMTEKKVKSKMLLTVHDELIFNVPSDEAEMMKELINEGMVNAMKLDVPLSAECAVGADWYEAK